ncbi:Rrf2 family transcriptional regulator [Variovorax sp. OV329]|uniref:Rrf2 family transcriptional regulator n=1 Tax=Variovorax sp. OV329 TaxID=1882825 RepID=UPI0008E60106|nr:Rrf2 family transcriptional regulator [Variovorax sp. OV329]SFN22859.1 transcriptional regulator, BadM/Rrf2 family [Variovorax sp. OV329]
MRLSTRARQAVIALIDVALHQNEGPVALAGISRRRNVSVSYLEQMFTELRRAGLVESTRGPGGGYEISRDPARITVADIVRAVDHAELKPVGRQREREASGEQQCLTPELWTALNRHVIEYLESVSLKMLVDEQPVPSPQAQPAPIRRLEPARQRVASPRPVAPNSVFELGRFVAP